MSKMIKMNEEYKKWVEDISKTFIYALILQNVSGCANYAPSWGAINRRGICASEWGAIT